MGLLDDAIREHLSLQRRNGLSDQEIAVKEAEALGPARRGELEESAPAAVGAATAEREPPEDEPPVTAEREPVEHEALATPEREEPVSRDDRIEDPPQEGALIEDPPPAGDDLVEEEEGDHDLDLADERLDIDMPAAQAQPPVDAEPVAESDDEPAPPSDDVLEETPDFLQETPEHERLWFEQKPPRDFDFDD